MPARAELATENACITESGGGWKKKILEKKRKKGEEELGAWNRRGEAKERKLLFSSRESLAFSAVSFRRG